MRKNILLIIGILSTSSIILFILLSSTFNQRNGFERNYKSNSPILRKEYNLYKLPIEVKDICNIDNNELFISTYDPRFYFKFDGNIELVDTLKIGFDNSLSQNIKSGFDATIIDSVLIIYAKNGGLVIRYNIGSQIYKIVKSPYDIITKSLTLDTLYSILRVFNQDNSQSFTKVNNRNGEEIIKGHILDSGLKGGFSTDGMLVYNKSESLSFYIQYYTNSYYCLDKNLNLVYKSHTIDTVFHNPIENSKFHTKKSGQFMPEVPLKNINKDAACFENRLIINSNLIADNEPLNQLQKNYIFDIYNTSTGKYISSILVPKFGTNNLLDFKVSKNNFTLLCNNKILSINVALP